MTGSQHRIDTSKGIERALAVLSEQDVVIARVLLESGSPVPRRREPGFEGLAQIVVGQQVSTASAAAIWGRLRAAIEPFEPGMISAASEESLRGVGLSRPKIKTLRAVAEVVESGGLDFESLGGLTAEDAHAALCAVHGIGPWTADIYLMFCLGHVDAWPAGDIALQHAVGAAVGLEHRPGPKEMAEIGGRWRPLRGAAALLFWAYYRTLRGRSGAPA